MCMYIVHAKALHTLQKLFLKLQYYKSVVSDLFHKQTSKEVSKTCAVHEGYYVELLLTVAVSCCFEKVDVGNY